ncbi:hypothetical protein [Bacillus sp. 1P06AnD]|uniref:hypothetical protein n=1 Tax=Bacillus sp. 1P06AnD TaxID=3132208 RepID=UPI00399FF21C
MSQNGFIEEGKFIYVYKSISPNREVSVEIRKIKNHSTPYVMAVVSNPIVTAHLYPKETFEEIIYPLLQDLNLTIEEVTILHYFNSKQNLNRINIWEFKSYLGTYTDDELQEIQPEKVCQDIIEFHEKVTNRIIDGINQ